MEGPHSVYHNVQTKSSQLTRHPHIWAIIPWIMTYLHSLEHFPAPYGLCGMEYRTLYFPGCVCSLCVFLDTFLLVLNSIILSIETVSLTLLRNKNIIKLRFLYLIKLLGFLRFHFSHSPSSVVQHGSLSKGEWKGLSKCLVRKDKIIHYYHETDWDFAFILKLTNEKGNITVWLPNTLSLFCPLSYHFSLISFVLFYYSLLPLRSCLI